jgi:hypothetical protein
LELEAPKPKNQINKLNLKKKNQQKAQNKLDLELYFLTEKEK